MLAPTHLIAGQAAYLALSLGWGHAPTATEGWLAAACALLPDLDKRQGVVGRWFPWISEPIEYHFGHRTVTHSLIVTLALGLGLWWLFPTGAWIAVVGGYASHPLADMMTPTGVEWLWPARWRCVLPGNERFRMRPMGWGELMFAALLAATCVGLAVLGRSAADSGGVISSAMGHISDARQRYDAQKGTNAWTLEVDGRNNTTYADVSGSYRVIGEYRGNGFIVRGPDGPVSVCRSASCDWYAESAVLERGRALQTATRRLQPERVRTESLLKALKPLSEAGRVYLRGTLNAEGVEAEPPTIRRTGNTVELNYARPSAIRRWPPVLLRAVELTAQVRHRGHADPPENVDLQGGDQAILPERLRPWVD